jgi:hypothetical protein
MPHTHTHTHTYTLWRACLISIFSIACVCVQYLSIDLLFVSIYVPCVSMYLMFVSFYRLCVRLISIDRSPVCLLCVSTHTGDKREVPAYLSPLCASTIDRSPVCVYTHCLCVSLHSGDKRLYIRETNVYTYGRQTRYLSIYRLCVRLNIKQIYMLRCSPRQRILGLMPMAARARACTWCVV